eukprot:gene15071-biopygen1020
MTTDDPPAPRGEHRRTILPAALAAVDQYDGRSDAHSWLSSFKELALIYEWNEADCLRIARVRFRGIAQRWAQPRQFHDWDDFERQFLERFGETPETAMVRLENCYQKTGESPKNFADRFLEEAERAGRRTDTALLHQFIRRLHPELRLEVTRQRPTTMEDAIEFCNYWTGANSEIGTDEYTVAKQQHPAGQNGAYRK